MEEKEVFVGPMVLVSRISGNMYPVTRGWITAPDEEDQVRFTVDGGIPGNPFIFCESDAVSIIELSEEKVKVNLTNLDGNSYTIRPVVDEDAAWFFETFGIPLPASGLEKVFTTMAEAAAAEEVTTVGTPSVMAFTRADKIEAVAFEISDVAMYFRVDGAWTTESPVDLEDTESTTIEPTKAAQFVDQWDEGSEGLIESLAEYAQAEEE